MSLQRWLLVLGVLGATGCPSGETCVPLDTRCQANVAQICGDDQQWQTFQDCTQTTQQSGQSFSCCNQAGDDAGTPAGATCLPDNQCAN